MDRLATLSPEKRKLLELRIARTKAEASGNAIQPRPRPDGTAPLSFAQQRLWLLERMEPGAAAYNTGFHVRLRGDLNVGALELAVNALRARHEALRTTFAERDGEGVQVIHPYVPEPLLMKDISGLPDDEREAAALRLSEESNNAPYDLERGPLMRMEIARVGPRDHLLMLSMHHIISDGWSSGVIGKELTALYEAFVAGKPDPLPPLAIQYADFAAWQREHLRGETLQRQLDFWRGALAGAPPALELPADRVRPAAPNHVGDSLTRSVPATVANRLREVARGEGATVFPVLLACWRLVLARHAGQDDVVIGTPVANRTRREIEPLVGFFVNTLALRTDLSGDPTFRHLLAREREAVLAAFSHQDLPFERIVEELKLPRDPSRNPVFQAMLTLQNAGTEKMRMGGLEAESPQVEYPVAKFDLTLDTYEEDDGGLYLLLDWAVELFERPTMERIADHLVALMASAAADPDLPVSRLGMMSADEAEAVVRGWNPAAPAIPAEPVHRLFEQVAAGSPAAPAIEWSGRTLSYSELNAAANRLAAHLVARGAGPESRIGVSMERGPELVVALLAIAKAGGAYVPLDPSYPAERLAYMTADAGVSILVVRDAVPEALAGFGGTVVSLDGDAADIAAADDGNRADEFAGPESLAYVVYTSGSTGEPKGIGIPHRGIVRLVREADFAQLAENDRVAQISNASFDAITWELWGALLNGATLVGIDRETILSPATLVEALRELRITAAFLTTALFNQVARTAPDGFAGLTHLCFGGEASDPLAVRAVLQAGGPRRLLHVYGPTESTTFATWQRVESVRADAPTVPIGGPIANTTAYVVDAAGSPVPMGVPGELVLGGAGIARGYLARPALTAEKFVPDPFAATTGARLYRSGDRVRRREDGSIEFLGRVDAQVKIRGFRIEPGEVEAALREVAVVEDCAVVARQDAPGEKRLVAYVVARGGNRPTAAELRDALRGRMPEYMVPGAFVLLDAFPLNANGKIDRRALPAPEAAAADEPRAEPTTETERALAAIWAEVLSVSTIGVDDDFFLLGGHSLLATRVISRIRRVLETELPLRAVFEASTIRRLAERVDAVRGQGGAESAIAPVPREGDLPLSFAQERMWFLEQMAPEAAAYNMPLILDLTGSVDADALRMAIEGVIARHETLRSVLPIRDGRPTLRIHPPAPFPLDVVEVADEEELDARLAADARAPFRLAAGPLVRATLFRRGGGEWTLLINMHHAISDGWSLDVFFREMAELYAAATEGRSAVLPELPIQYVDFAGWQREWLRGETLERQVRFWRERLRGVPAVLELPADRPRPASPSYRGGRIDFQIPAGVNARVQALAAAENATLFMAALAAFQSLLGRYARQDDVVVGTPVAGRTRPETEGLVGFFVNTLALRGDLSGDPSFRALLHRVRETTLESFAHQDLPFERLVDELRIERSTAYPPLFQVMFALQNAPGAAPVLPGVSVGFRGAEHHSAKFDLMLDLYEDGGDLHASLEFARDLWDEETARRMADHYTRLLAAAAADPDAPLSAHALAGDEELRTVERWSRGAEYATHERSTPVHALFSRQAADTPDAVALAWDGGTMTFAALEEGANRLANHLARTAVPGSRVGVCLERGPAMVVAVLAALKAGCTYVPLDPLYPADRLAYMVHDARMQAVIADSATRGSVESAGVPVVDVDASRDAILSEAATDPRMDLGPEAMAYVIYTSGSTGRPKGVAVPHRGIVRLVRGADYAELGPGETFLQIVPVSFDVATWELWAPLLNGGRLVLYPPRIPEPAEIRDVVRRHGVTTLWLTSGLFHVVADEALDAFDGLRQFFSGGDILSVAHVRRLQEAYPALRIVDGYGPTENTTYTTCHTVRAQDLSRTSIPIGRPIAGTTTFVLDSRLRPCPVGVVGELYTGGDGLATGYLERPGMTAEKFIPNPFDASHGARMYRIGDLARWLPDGTLEFLGRLDTQIKVRGFRIEPGEIEAALQTHPAIEDACVIARADSRGDKRLIAYVVPRDGRMPELAELRETVRERLPDYMVPAAFVPMAELPLNPNGKVDRNALPTPEMADDRIFAAPATETERALAALWTALLGVERIGVDDGFFDLGGHSLLATQLVSRIRAGLGAELPLRAIFEAPTLGALAERVDAARGRADAAGPPLVAVPRDGAIPLSFAQERMWFIDRMLPSAAYNMPFRLHLAGAVDPGALQAGLADLVARHEPLRTTFRSLGGQPSQVVHPFRGFTLPVIDLTDHPMDEARSEADRITAAEAVRPFDLEAGPLFRASLIRIAADEARLTLDMHHIVSDGWSMEVLYRELAALYDARLAGTPDPLPPLALQYADYAAWQRGWLAGERLEAQLAHWRRVLAGATPLELPTDRPRPATASLRGGWMAFDMSYDTMVAVQSIAKAENATPFQTLLAAFALLLSRYAGQDDVVVGAPIAGRTRAESEGLIGLFVNTLAMRTDLSGDPTYRELIGRVREATLDAYAHQEVPFEKLVDELKVERTLSRHPLFQVTFTVDEGNAAPTKLRLGAAVAETEGGDTRTAKFDLTCGFTLREDGMFGGFEYAADLFDAATIERMAQHLAALVAELVAAPDVPLSRLPPLLGGDERERVLREWAGTDHPLPDARVHELFSAQARRTPDATALRGAGRTLTYRDLDEQSNRLAAHLVARGVRPETRVGVFAERSADTVIAILAILKAGGAYVPLDPAYPAERLRYMIVDAGVRTVIAPAGVPAGLPAGMIADLLDVAAEAEAIAARPADDPRVAVDAENLAYVIYTSGSTGLPKGVLVTHRGVPNLALGQIGQFRIDGGSRLLQFASFSFDAAVSELFTTLLSGATLVMATREELLPGPALAATMRDQGVTHVTLPPSVLAVLMPDELTRLQTLVSAGEAVSASTVERWGAGRRFVNAYGPTESTVGPCCGVCLPDGRTPSIGRPLRNVRIYVLDGTGEPSPVGVPGELCIGGVGVARGYLHRAGQTAERFVPDVFGTPGSRLYRTGDRARWRADGELEFLGRIDEQVKVRGFRVEPGEIAARIAGIEGVRDALVILREDRPGDRRLVAYLLPVQEGSVPSATALREHLKRALPEYMVPSAFVVLEAFPMTPNGKVDRAALPLPATDEAGPRAAPQGELEGRIAGVWMELLGRASVGVHENFFDIGGHSLLLAQLQERLQTALGRPVGLIDLFQYPTVSTFAARLEAVARAEAPRPVDDGEGEPEGPRKEGGLGRGSARRQMLQRGRR
ncbi:MAG TPA: amino acid adenylation domain-containing protein [Longimicrobium sp.]|uniref:non-ribosomal peptide synthetase n=1 Tax=Longimicrobium sp. TaxID=2029185 RepID=UPI002EDA00B4